MQTIQRKLAIPLLIAAAVLSGCNQQTEKITAHQIDQEQICEVNKWQKDVTARACKPGQKIVFLPGQFGNEQLPVIFAAVNCDLRYSVALTNGAVACIYKPIKPDETPAEQKK
jgi:hypothetical protein